MTLPRSAASFTACCRPRAISTTDISVTRRCSSKISPAPTDMRSSIVFSRPAGLNTVTRLGLDLRADGRFRQRGSGALHPGQENIPCLNMHFVMRKTRSAPFRCELEIATTHSPVDGSMARRYQNDVVGQLDKTQTMVQSTAGLDDVLAQRDQASSGCRRFKGEIEQIYGSRSWRLTAPLRALGAALRRG